jgi:ADP-heptose:LPS heptosyltransferase
VKLTECKRILVVKPSSLGDIIHTLPAVEAIHRAAPDAKIDWLVNTGWSPLLKDVTFLDRLISFPRKEFRGISGGLKAVTWAKRVLQQTHYDLTLDFQGLFRSALLSRLTKTSRVMGFQKTREGASLFYDEKVMVQNWTATHAVDRNLALAKAAGADIVYPNFGLPEGDPVEGLTPISDKPTILLHPFSRGGGKSLSTNEVIELADQLAPTPIILVGVFEGNAPGMWPDNITDLIGQTSLPQLIHLIRLCNWTVSVDSGPMHLAAGITDRVLSLHTWSNPAMVGPWPKSSYAFREGEIVQVIDLTPDRFPERRDLKSAYGKQPRLFKPDDIKTITSFLRMQLAK